jgi:LCP family protein required for cell wall assembly
VSGQRADTLILAHIDPATQKVTMVQFPRDLLVPMPDGGRDKINSALTGGKAELVSTVQGLTGLEINHYIQVNIAGFKNLVDAIGGVEVCVPEPIEFDEQTGLQVTPDEVGMVEFDGERALRFVRSRAFVTGDFERIQNQQKFIAAALDKIVSTSTFFQPGRINALADVARANLEVDQHTTIRGLADIGQRLRSFDPETYEAYAAPNLGVGTANIGGVESSIVVADRPSMRVMFDAIAANESPAAADGVPDIDPSSIAVGVYNGVGLERPVAAPAVEELKQAIDIGGQTLDFVEVANAARFGYQGTTIRYNSRDAQAELKAEFLAAAMPDAMIETGKVDDDLDVAVIVGEGKFTTRKVAQLTPLSIPTPGDLPEVCREG